MGAGCNRWAVLQKTLLLAALFVLVRSHSAFAQNTVEQIPTVELVATAEASTQLITPPASVGARPRDRGAFTQAMIATVAGNAFDGITTIVGVHSGRAREVNPLLGQSTTRIVLMKTLFTLPQILAEKHLVDTGHPTTAKWVGYVVGGVAAAVAIHNVQVISR